jgi:hypothetical protein
MSTKRREWTRIVAAFCLLGMLARLLAPLAAQAQAASADALDRVTLGSLCLSPGASGPAPADDAPRGPAPAAHCPLCRLPDHETPVLPASAALPPRPCGALVVTAVVPPAAPPVARILRPPTRAPPAVPIQA